VETGNGYHVEIQNSADGLDFVARGITVSAWVKAQPAWGCIAAKQNADRTKGWILDIAGGGNVVFEVRGVATGPYSSEIAADGEWHMVTGTYSTTGEMVVYVDGDPKSKSGTASNASGSGMPMLLGAETGAGGTPLTGMIDEVQIFNYAKDAHGVIDMFNAIAEPDQSFCVDTYPKALDVVPDCVINLKDFAKVAESWLVDGLYP
jgi:hypothetical protein